MHKYRAKPTTVDNIRFDSLKESRRYVELKTMQQANLIRALQVHPRFPIEVSGRHICTYEADFSYFDALKNNWITEDCKGIRTAVYRLKKKLFETLYQREILET